MDDRRFDALTRSLATGLSRRNVLKGLFGGAVLGGTAAVRVDDAAAQVSCSSSAECAPDGFCCNGFCCPNANNCCNGVCCPSSQCNQAVEPDFCCESFEFACGTTAGNICCNTAEEKCCEGVCISSTLCCPSLPDCPGELCCPDGACHECCGPEDCLATADSCVIVSCVEGVCNFQTLVCNICEACSTGQCVSTCAVGETCCPSGCEDLQNDPTNCGECAADCSAGLVCCSGECRECCFECCDNADCTTFETCEVCIEGSCQRACAEDEECCISGTIEDILIECVPECCEDEDCDDCHSCNADGVCVPDTILCELGTQACCVEGELICAECCGHADCGECEVCIQGACEEDPECCPHFGDPCGLIINGTFIATGSEQLNCCPGLVCCDPGEHGVCAECCGDFDCPKGTICCAGVCREIECCIDDILVGLDPNRRCSKDCTCFEGICVDPKTFERCHCHSDKDCRHDECCCKDGTCSKHCCVRGCEHDKDCPHGTCCCHDGSCSAHCCDFVCHSDKDCAHGTCCCKDGTCSASCCPPTGGPKVDTLPGTGIGDEQEGLGIIGAAALGAAAAYIAGKKLREEKPEAMTSEE